MSTLIHSRRGQTLVEALVALSILTMGFIGIISLLSRSFQLNRTASDDTQATYLAAEGIEIAKNIIDYDVYYGFRQSTSTNDWGCSFNLSSGQSADYELDYTKVVSSLSGCGAAPGKVSSAAQAQAAHLYFNPSTTLYTYNSFAPAVQSDFTRDIRITNDGEDLNVQSIVKWTSGSLSNTITLEDYFYNWHP